MSDFEAVGRHVAATVDSAAEQPVAGAVKALWPWAGFDGDDNPNHSWKVEWWKNENGFAVAATLVEKNVYEAEPAPAPAATVEELARQRVEVEAVEELGEPGEKDVPTPEVLGEERDATPQK